ncbi:MAG: hypothetical protein ACREQY_04710 [Candidatus Binatia bacterium]
MGGLVALSALTLYLGSCGDDGGGRGTGTIFEGNTAGGQVFLRPGAPSETRLAWLELVRTAHAQGRGTEVCLAGSSNCTVIDENNRFRLVVDGDLQNPCLDIVGFGQLCFGFFVPRGSRVSARNVSCNDGSCSAEDVDVDEPSPSASPSDDPSDEDFPSDPSPGEDPSPSPDDPSPSGGDPSPEDTSPSGSSSGSSDPSPEDPSPSS